MPITLNHSNIGVQYSTGSNYIIETVKSDLYRRNEIVDTIVRDNIQTAPVTSIISIQDGSNVYAVESYTYSGSANTADYTRVFTKNTTCDILIIGGGGGGGASIGSGGGGGGLLYYTGLTITANTYTISVGNGGTGATNYLARGANGSNSSAIGYTAYGGGGGAGQSWVYNQSNTAGGTLQTTSANQGSGGGGTRYKTLGNAGTSGQGNSGGNSSSDQMVAGGGGGAGGVGGTAQNTIGGLGGAGTYNSITGSSIGYAGGGAGSGGNEVKYGALATEGGGNSGPINGSGGFLIGGAGTNGRGGGGGGGADSGGNGGSGIVIIRYLLGTIPSTNLLTNEPVVIAPTFTESIRTFTHSGGAETQTPHTITIGRDTICDILIVGGGGGGGKTDAGGGGAGGLIYIQNITLFGNYTIQIGKGGLGGVGPNVTSVVGNKGGNSSITGTNANYVSYGGGGGGYGYPSDIEPSNLGPYGSSGGLGTSDQTREIFNINTPGQGHLGGLGTATEGGGGGGGSGGPGVNSGNGGIGTQINITGTNLYYAGGGGGGHNPSGTSGGLGGGGSATNSIGNNATFYGGGGGGGGGNYGNGGNGFAGIVIIKFKSTTAILDGITHKRLNFYYSPNYPIIQADNTNLIVWYKFDDPGYLGKDEFNLRNLTNTIVSTTSDLIGTSASFTNETYLSIANFNLNFDNTITTTGISFSFWFKLDAGSEYYGHLFTWGTHNSLEKFALIRYNLELKLTIQQGTNLPNTFDILAYNTWIHLVINIDTSRVLRVYQNTILVYTLTLTPSLYSGLTTSSPFTLGRANGVNMHDYRGGIEDFRIYNKILTLTEISQLYSISTPNIYTYTLNFPVPTLADINNNSNIVLRGAYDLALSTSNALIIPKEGQYIPKPTTFTNYAVERMYPPLRNFTAATTTISGQTYGNGTYVVSYSSYHETFQPFKCFNTSDTIGGHWVDNYTNGNYNGSANIVSGYLGDWLKIQLPVAIKLTRFSFVQRTDIPSRSPKDFKIYGSNDNITWVELINKTDAIYNASYIYEKTTPEITNTYTYYGLVVNKLLAGQYNTVLNFDEWYIYGQEPSNSLSIRYNILNPILDPIGAQWTYNTSNTNVYHMGRVGIGTTSPEYQIDVSGTLNAKAYYFNGVQIGRLSEGMVANVQHLTYTHMEIKNNTGWDAINDDLTTGFVISITPKSNLSKILVNLIAHIGLTTVNDARWWGIKLYRKIGTAAWAEVTGSNGTETGSAATTAGTPVWISHNMGTTTGWYAYQIINLTGTYLDSPNTTSTVYYTAYWNQRIGNNPSGTGELWLNRAANQDDAYRPAPSSSWTVKEIWYG